MTQATRNQWVLMVALVVALLVSLVNVYDGETWVLETVPVMIALPLLFFSRQRFPLTSLLLTLIFIHSLVLIIGGHYTYARVPAGFWVQDWFGFTRNHYDRLGHFLQGFEPAVLAREILLRRQVVRRADLPVRGHPGSVLPPLRSEPASEGVRPRRYSGGSR